MAYTFTPAELAIVATCNGDLAKIKAAHALGSLSIDAALQAVQDASAVKVVCKVKMQDSGTVSLTGINGKWGASYYPSQWKSIAENIAEILKVCEDNAAELARRGEATKLAKQAAKNAPPVAPVAAPATPPVNAA